MKEVVNRLASHVRILLKRVDSLEREMQVCRADVNKLFHCRHDGVPVPTAVLAAALEHLIHNEAEGRLGKDYNIAESPRSSSSQRNRC